VTGSKLFEKEDVLPDEYPIYGNYWYVVDGGDLYQSDHHDITVKELKRREGFKEVRRCNIVARQKAWGLI
jgi:hypothetical protein